MEPHKGLPAVSYISNIIYYIYIHIENICETKTQKLEKLVIFKYGYILLCIQYI